MFVNVMGESVNRVWVSTNPDVVEAIPNDSPLPESDAEPDPLPPDVFLVEANVQSPVL